MKAGLVVDGDYIYEEEKHLTVLKTSLFFANDGFTVYDCKGQLVFRVDSYGPDPRDKAEVVLMDAHGRCLLTVRKKAEFASPVGRVFRRKIGGSETGLQREKIIDNRTVWDDSGGVQQSRGRSTRLKEISDSEAARSSMRTFFLLSLKPGFDGAFAMGLVLVLDQVIGDDSVENDEPEISPTAED
ncbi:putative pentatricopeptide repeat-containing protein [Hibiscus syriacus]|uniref:Pentatricopeptide repeat-containing protein n=1 Tax=Hibiscus syriacus TaxID=106335 RepID=A0A6A2WEI2_HIBSY|nr:putative pentatricopeptide repeat-containing protein [Hibiscus syriacus]